MGTESSVLIIKLPRRFQTVGERRSFHAMKPFGATTMDSRLSRMSRPGNGVYCSLGLRSSVSSSRNIYGE
ncbi:hypothetical protein I7I50_10652 [Histoplasma capsulatum G186AR]|uniref:Uncharacterized protein n=1 Tax=Ajellomyces capsulatus TaxID=5037 RepID=A0A8H7Z9S3_AJECA|nr:hypothetical protein I7I52_01890 [Histoplasma capsulatum]QSS69375.1 hypothetical protein I7I50_10652 [Histoplasma capsulatum G186AR]